MVTVCRNKFAVYAEGNYLGALERKCPFGTHSHTSVHFTRVSFDSVRSHAACHAVRISQLVFTGTVVVRKDRQLTCELLQQAKWCSFAATSWRVPCLRKYLPTVERFGLLPPTRCSSHRLIARELTCGTVVRNASGQFASEETALTINSSVLAAQFRCAWQRITVTALCAKTSDRTSVCSLLLLPPHVRSFSKEA